MRTLTKCNLDSMQLEMELLHESEQRRVLGGTGSCDHGISTDSMCPECSGLSVVSFEDYLSLEQKGLWKGGWYKGTDGSPSYAPPSSGGGVKPITGYCQQHGNYRGDECFFPHSGKGDKYCQDHYIWYDGSDGCTKCLPITGYCADHNKHWKEGDGACTECNVTGYCGEHNLTWKGTGDCSACESTAERITGYCESHDQRWVEGSGHCNVCEMINPGGESGGDSGSGTGSGSSGTGGGGTGGGGTGDNNNPAVSIDYVLTNYTDSTFTTQKKNEFAEAMTSLNNNDVGAFLYDKVFQNDSGVHFTIGETSTYIDPVTGEKSHAIANYDISENTITFNPLSDISYGTLQEELVHVVQGRTYTQMNNRDLNYEFEAKVIGCVFGGTLIPDNMGFSTLDNVVFSEFIGSIIDGTCDEKTLMTGYNSFLEKWNQPGYTDQPERNKSKDFNPQILKELNQIFRK